MFKPTSSGPVMYFFTKSNLKSVTFPIFTAMCKARYAQNKRYRTPTTTTTNNANPPSWRFPTVSITKYVLMPITTKLSRVARMRFALKKNVELFEGIT